MSAARGLSRRQPSGSAAVELRAEAARVLTEWLIREGRFLPDNDELFTEFCERLAVAGMPLDRATLHLRALHPDGLRAGHGFTDTLTLPVVQQHWNPPPPSPE